MSGTPDSVQLPAVRGKEERTERKTDEKKDAAPAEKTHKVSRAKCDDEDDDRVAMLKMQGKAQWWTQEGPSPRYYFNLVPCMPVSLRKLQRQAAEKDSNQTSFTDGESKGQSSTDVDDLKIKTTMLV